MHQRRCLPDTIQASHDVDVADLASRSSSIRRDQAAGYRRHARLAAIAGTGVEQRFFTDGSVPCHHNMPKAHHRRVQPVRVVPAIEPEHFDFVARRHERHESVLRFRNILVRDKALGPRDSPVRREGQAHLIGIGAGPVVLEPVSGKSLVAQFDHGRKVCPVHEQVTAFDDGYRFRPGLTIQSREIEHVRVNIRFVIPVGGRFQPAQNRAT